jgi:hypothetical protein
MMLMGAFKAKSCNCRQSPDFHDRVGKCTDREA